MTNESEVMLDARPHRRVRAARDGGVALTHENLNTWTCLLVTAGCVAVGMPWECVPHRLTGEVKAAHVRAWLTALERAKDYFGPGGPAWPVELRHDVQPPAGVNEVVYRDGPKPGERIAEHRPARLRVVAPLRYDISYLVRGMLTVFMDAVENNVPVVFEVYVPPTEPSWRGDVQRDTTMWPQPHYLPEIPLDDVQ